MYISISGDMAKCYEHLAASHNKRSHIKKLLFDNSITLKQLRVY